NVKMSSNKKTAIKINDSSAPKTNDNNTSESNYSSNLSFSAPRTRQRSKLRQSLSYKEIWGKISKDNLERDKMNDDND
ncbi:6068_t:CDS:2, partial [Ambispora leptoticha]